jgi:methyl-accepting chemotaxis protein
MPRLQLTIGRKIYAIIALSFLGFLGITTFQMRGQSVGLEDQKRVELKHLGEIALDMVKEEYAAAEKGAISTEEAQKRAGARVVAMRYGNGDYFWINDMHLVMVMHPLKPEMNGTDISQFKDPNGKRLFAEMVDVVKLQGSGYVRYEWPKPGVTKPQPKLSYVVGFAPWGWVVGTGVYIDDLDQQMWDSAKLVLLITVIVLLLTGAISAIVAGRISGAMRSMTRAMAELASGNFDVVLPGLGRRDEIGAMAREVEAFKLKAV